MGRCWLSGCLSRGVIPTFETLRQPPDELVEAAFSCPRPKRSRRFDTCLRCFPSCGPYTPGLLANCLSRSRPDTTINGPHTRKPTLFHRVQPQSPTRTDFFTRPIFRALHATQMLVRIQPGPLLWPCSQTEKAPPFEGGDLIAHGSATRACETLSTAWNSRGLSSDLAFAPARGWANFRWSARSTDFVHPSARAPHATLHGSPVRIRPPLRRL